MHARINAQNNSKILGLGLFFFMTCSKKWDLYNNILKKMSIFLKNIIIVFELYKKYIVFNYGKIKKHTKKFT